MTALPVPTLAPAEIFAAAQQPPPRSGGLPWPEARRQAGAAAVRLAPRRLSLQAACGRLLAADLVALTNLPATDISAMDEACPWSSQ